MDKNEWPKERDNLEYLLSGRNCSENISKVLLDIGTNNYNLTFKNWEWHTHGKKKMMELDKKTKWYD